MLRIGVLSAAAVVLMGAIPYLIRYGSDRPHYEVFQGEPLPLRSPEGILSTALAFESRGIIQLGLLLLILTPVARVLFSAAAFIIQRDRLYAGAALVVLTVLLYNLLLG